MTCPRVLPTRRIESAWRWARGNVNRVRGWLIVVWFAASCQFNGDTSRGANDGATIDGMTFDGTAVDGAVDGALTDAAAPGSIVPVINGSFETPGQSGGTGNQDPAPGWSTGPQIGGADAIFVEGRWTPNALGNDYAGPTHGLQVLVLDDRPDTGTSRIEQTLGTLGSLALSGDTTKLQFNFDARFGGFGTDGGASVDNIEQESIEFEAYWKTGGTAAGGGTPSTGAIAAGSLVSSMGSVANGRIIPTKEELEVIHGDLDAPQMVTSNNMGNLTVELDVAGLATTDNVTLGFSYTFVDELPNFQTRVLLDNVTVTEIGG
jgi:hypothetical protein